MRSNCINIYTHTHILCSPRVILNIVFPPLHIYVYTVCIRACVYVYIFRILMVDHACIIMWPVNCGEIALRGRAAQWHIHRAHSTHQPHYIWVRHANTMPHTIYYKLFAIYILLQQRMYCCIYNIYS